MKEHTYFAELSIDVSRDLFLNAKTRPLFELFATCLYTFRHP